MTTAHTFTPAPSRSACPGRPRPCSPCLALLLLGTALACNGSIDTQDTGGASPSAGGRSGGTAPSGTAPATTSGSAAGMSSPGEQSAPDVAGISSGANAGGSRRSSRGGRVNANVRADAGADDAGADDARDAGVLDAGADDAGVVDAGLVDAAL
jgi:hypothetical protein